MCAVIFLFMAVKVKEGLCNMLSTFAIKNCFARLKIVVKQENVNMAFAGHNGLVVL